MRPSDTPRRVAELWRLAWNDSELACVVYHVPSGMEVRLESAAGTILQEPFELQPRALARTRALRSSLLRRGWREA